MVSVRSRLADNSAGNRPEHVAAYGDQLTVSGRLLELRGYRNPGQLDAMASARRQGISARLSAGESDVVISAGGSAGNWQTRLTKWREGVRRDMEKVMPASDAAMITGMLFGGYAGIRQEVIRDFAATGIIHILSVSGTHIALVAGAIIWLGGRLGPRFRRITGVVAVLAVLLYAAVSGFTPPVVRSAAMGILALGAVALGREQYAPAVLSATALTMLVYQPALLYDISFQLSFAATAGLVFLYQPTLRALQRWPDWLATPVAVTTAAQLAVAPFIAWYYNTFSLSAFIANLLIVPLAEGIVIAGLVGALLAPVFTAVSPLIYVGCSLLTGIVSQLTAVLAAVPGGVIYLPSVGLVGGLLYYLLLAWIYGYHPEWVVSPPALGRRYPISLTAFACSGVLLLLFWLGRPQPLAIHFIDVGQGDAALILTPRGRAVLVDAGGTMATVGGFDIGERVVVPYLKHYGVRSLEYLLLSHGHQDHAGGAAGVAMAVPVKNLLLPRRIWTKRYGIY